MKSRRHTLLQSPRQTAHLALCLLLLCALGVQQWAVQSHWHTAQASAQPGFDAPADDPGERFPGHDCVWCQIAAHAGSAAPPMVWAGVPATSTSVFHLLLTAAQPGFSSAPAWAWQSRGPPAV
jgi:hypothetical protein